MREQHVTRHHYEAVERGEIPPEALHRRFREHALELCPVCDGELEAYLQGKRQEGPNVAIILALLRTIEEEGRRLEERARQELAELMKASPDERMARVRRARKRFRNPLLADLLIESSRQRVFADPREAAALAALAFEVAARANHGLSHEPMTLAKAYQANALRVEGDLKAAERPMAAALANLGKLERPEAQAEILNLAASLRLDQRRFDEALRLIDLAIQLDSEAGDKQGVGQKLVLKSQILFEIGRVEEAIAAAQQALERLDRRRNFRVYVAAEHTLLCFLIDAGYVGAAQERFEEAQALYDALENDPSIQLRRRWLEAKIAQGSGDMEQAERSLLAARDGFLTRGSGYDAALVSLDLALLYEKQGRLEELQELADAILPVFRSQDIHREAAAALALCVRAASRKAARRR